jgi:hypothetical protein
MASDDGTIRIGTEVDISGIQDGMKEAQATVSESTSEMQSAYERLASATSEYATTQANLRKAVSDVVTGQTKNAQATQSLIEPLTAQAAATRALQDAKAALIAIEAEETEGVRNGMSARMAATAEMRVFEGSIQGSSRAAGAFLSMLPGVGQAMQMAFPVFGAVALIGVLAQVASSVGDVITAYKNLDGEAIKASTDAIIAGEKIVSIKPEKFSANTFARWTEGAPSQQAISVDQASPKLKEIQYARELADAQAAVNEQGKTGVALQQQKIADAQKDLQYAQQAKAQADALVKSYKDQLEAKIQITTEGNANLGIQDQTTTVQKISDPKQIDAITQQLKTAVQAADEFGHSIDMMKVKLQGAEIKLPSVEDKGDASAARKAAEEARKAAEAKRAADEAAIQADRQYLDEMKSLHATTAEDEANYWMGVAMTAKSGSKEYTTAIDEANKSLGRYQQETAELSQHVGQQLRETWDAAQKAAEEATKKQQELASASAEAAERMVSAQQGAANAVAEANLRAGEASGGIRRVAAAEEQARLHAQAYREELQRLDAELTKVAQDASLTPQQRTQQQGQLQAQKVQVQGQAQATGITDQANVQQQIAQPYMQAFQQINQSWMQVQNQMMFSTRNVGLMFAKMGQQIFISIVDSMEKAVLVAAEHDLMMVAFHQAANQAKVTSDGVAAAQSEAISSGSMMKKLVMEIVGIFHHTAANTAKTTSDVTSAAVSASTASAANVLSAESYAAVAGVAAMASAAAIPVVGWAMAPGVGMGVYSAAAALGAMAAFEDGTGYVPRDGVAMLHEGEAVVPAPTMDQLRGSNGSGGDVTINHTTNINAQSDKAVIAAIQRNPHIIAGALQKHMRQGGRG